MRPASLLKLNWFWLRVGDKIVHIILFAECTPTKFRYLFALLLVYQPLSLPILREWWCVKAGCVIFAHYAKYFIWIYELKVQRCRESFLKVNQESLINSRDCMSAPKPLKIMGDSIVLYVTRIRRIRGGSLCSRFRNWCRSGAEPLWITNLGRWSDDGGVK